MGKLRFVSALFLALVFMIPPGTASAVAGMPEEAAIAAYAPASGTWTGKTNLGYGVSFAVNSTGTSWSNFRIRTSYKFPNGCVATVDEQLAGPAPITSGKFSWTTTTFRFTGTFTSGTTATGTFTWTNRVVTYCSNQKFSQSGTWTAKAPPAPPGAFSKVSPANAAINQRVYPVLSWGTSVGASSYEYCVTTTNVNPCGGVFKTTGTSTSVTVGPLTQNTTYYWQARARNSTGVMGANAGTWWTFKTGILPGAFSKSSPANAATSQPLASLLTWTASSGATSYRYCFDTVNDNKCNTSWVSIGNVTSIDPPGVFLPSKTYYWSVQAVNAIGAVLANAGTWWSFSTVPPTQLVLPSVGSQDGWIVESTETSGMGGNMNWLSGTFALGDDKLNRQFRSILSFNTNSLPSGAVLVGVSLRIRRYSVTPANPFATLGNILGDIQKGGFSSNAALQLTDFQAAASKLAVLTIANTPVNNWYAGTLGSANFGYINRAGVTQIRLRFATDDNNNRVADYMSFYSGNAAGYRPQLVLQYYVP